MNLLKKITLADTISELKNILDENFTAVEDQRYSVIIEEAWKNRLFYKSVEEEAQLDQNTFLATNILNFSNKIEENFAKFADKIREIIEFDTAVLALISEKNNTYTNFTARMINGKSTFLSGNIYPIEHSSLSWIYTTRKPLLIDDLAQRKMFVEDNFLFNTCGIRSGIRMPLIDDKKIIGMLAINSKEPSKYSHKHIKIIKLLAAQVTAIIKNANLYASMKQKKEEYKITQKKLKEINGLLEILVKQRSVSSLFEAAFKEILSIVNREAGAIYLLDAKKTFLDLAFSEGLSIQFCDLGRKLEVGQGNTGKAAAIGKTIIVGDVNKQEMLTGMHSKEGILSACYIPLRAKKKVIGVMSIASKTYRQFTSDEIETLESLSSYLALFIERLKLVEQLSEIASIDSLSGLYNRTVFFKELKTQIDRAERYGEKFSILMLDIDYFKNFNDAYGHLAGDRLIKKIGKMILATVRQGDIAARYGGEEFALISYGTDSGEAFLQAERLRKIIEEKCKSNNITISIGIAAYPEDGIDGEILLMRADEALYEAKRCNRNCVKMFRSIASIT